MPRKLALVPALIASLALSAGAEARSFVVTTTGNSPSVAVDAKGVAHVAWDSQEGDTSTTHYCRVPRAAKACAPGTERTFAPAAGDQDFGGPRLFLTGGAGVLIVTSRCCSGATGPDGRPHSEHVFAISSADNGGTFGAPAWIGTQRPDSAAYASGTFFSLGITGGGTGLQAAPVAGFEGRENTVTTMLATTSGIGLSPRGNVVAFGSGGKVYAGAMGADPNASPIAFRKIANGTDVSVTSGPKGADVVYRTMGGDSRIVARRYAGGKAGRLVKVSELGYPIFGTSTQDAAGRLHAAWRGLNGLTYRRSGKTGRGFGKPVKLAPLTGNSAFYNLAIAANAKGNAAVVYDGNIDAGRVAGFTTG